MLQSGAVKAAVIDSFVQARIVNANARRHHSTPDPRLTARRAKGLRTAIFSRDLARRALPLVGLVIVISITTYGLNLFATLLAPTPSAVPLTQTTIDRVQDNGTLPDDAPLDLRASQVDSAAESSPKSDAADRSVVYGEPAMLTITVDGPNASVNVLCATTTDRAPFERLHVHPEQVMDAFHRWCSPGQPSPGQPD
jgi:hypothetical protein